MLDIAPTHKATFTINELAVRGIILNLWPARSPDLNFIEIVSNQMKNWIEIHYPDEPLVSSPHIMSFVEQ